MRKKKDLPLIVLQTLNPYLKKKDENYRLVNDHLSLLKFVDRDESSDFYFEVKSTSYEKGKTYFQIEFKPQNQNTISKYSVKIGQPHLEKSFSDWSKNLKAYDTFDLYDDAIIRENEKRFNQQFDIIDEDADYASFNLQQQLFLDEYLENAKTALLQLKEGKQKEDGAEIEDLIQDVEVVKQNLTKETKRQIIKRLARFWGKAQKVGLPILKEVFVNVATELTKRLLTGQ